VKKKRATTAQRRKRGRPVSAVAPRAVTATELKALRREIERRMKSIGRERDAPPGRRSKPRAGAAPLRWNPDPADVRRSVAQLVLTIAEFLRRLMERQAIRRMEQETLTTKEVEAVGAALMELERTIRDIGKQFGLTPEDLNLDLGPLGTLM
jgi:hypothetical protein